MLILKPRRTFFRAALFISLFFLMGSCVPTVRKAEKVFTPSIKDEKRIGREFAAEARRKLILVRSLEVQEYVNRIGHDLLRAIGRTPYTFRFFVVKNPQLNAFAAPGGYIYLFSGMILKTKDINELAGIMAHEISHVKLRHMAKLMGKGTLINLATLAAILLSRGERAVAVSAAGAGKALQLKFTREFEREADRIGLFALYRAGYDPHGLINIFSTLLREQFVSTSRVPPYLLTHPVTLERINTMENLITIHRLQVRNPKKDPDFYRFKGILQAEVEEAYILIPLLERRVQKEPKDAHLLHQLGIVYLKNGWTEEAIKAIERALELKPDLYQALNDLAIIKMRMGRWQEGEALLRHSLEIVPDYPPTYHLLGELALKQKDFSTAISLFRKALSLGPWMIRPHYHLSAALRRVKRVAESYLEMAQYFRKQGMDQKAIDYLERAVKVYGKNSLRGKEILRKIEEIRSS